MISITKKILGLLILSLGLLPSIVFASEVYVSSDKSDYRVGDTIVFNVLLNTDGKEINTIDGSMTLSFGPKSIIVKELPISESVFSLWPRKPSLGEGGKSISFVGGVPFGVNGTDKNIFKVIIKATKKGKVELKPSNIALYINDGKGTLDKVSVKPYSISIDDAKKGTPPIDEWSGVVKTDTTPPQSFEIVFGSDPSIYDGKKFITFNTSDRESGIDHFEVKEGDRTAVRSGKEYVLEDQKLDEKITVFAYDKAGNITESTYLPMTSAPNYEIMIVILVVLLGVVVGLFWILKNRRKNVLTE